MVPRPAETLLKTRQVAEALGVGVSTIKRWVDSGAISATRTLGKHRLIAVAEAIRFAREQDLPHVRLDALLGLGGSAIDVADGRLRDALSSALTRGREGEARELIGRGYSALGASGLADDVLRPVMESVGHEWSTGALDVYQEHRGSRIVEAALIEILGRVSAPPPRPGSPRAIGASPSGDHYTISSLLCELALRELGWEVTNLGPDLPLSSLAEATRALRPRLVWLSIHHIGDLDGFVRDYRAFHQAASTSGSAVCRAGLALDASIRARLVAASFGDRLAHLVDFAIRLVPGDRGPTEPPDATETDHLREQP